MAIQIEEYKNNNTESKGYGMYYGRAVDNPPMSLDELVEHMANHNTPYSPGCIKGVLTDMVKCVRHLLLDGTNVKIDDLVIRVLVAVAQPPSSATTLARMSRASASSLRPLVSSPVPN